MTTQMKLLRNTFNHFFSRYQTGLKTSMRGSDFIFDCVHLLYYKCHEISPNWGGSYIEFPD